MLHIISALLICVSSAAWAQDAKPLELAADAPERHIVVPGDTLWDLAKMFLKDPFRWPEIWRMNADDIKDPHWIYPGQVIVLDRSGGQPRLTIEQAPKDVKAQPRVYVEDVQRAIPSIPPRLIEPFLSQPLVVDAETLAHSARIVALPEGRTIVGKGDVIYATGVRSEAPLWQIFRPGKPLRDPARPDEVLGVEAVYLGEARFVRNGELATFVIDSSRQEIGTNDLLMRAPASTMMNYAPRAPAQVLRGRILGLYGNVGVAGRFSIVSISLGARDGVERGHVLAIESAGADVRNIKDGKVERFRLPDERYGSLFVFRVFDRVSYALVMEATRPVVAGDSVSTP